MNRPGDDYFSVNAGHDTSRQQHCSNSDSICFNYLVEVQQFIACDFDQVNAIRKS